MWGQQPGSRRGQRHAGWDMWGWCRWGAAAVEVEVAAMGGGDSSGGGAGSSSGGTGNNNVAVEATTMGVGATAAMGFGAALIGVRGRSRG